MAELARFEPKTKTLGQIADFLGIEVNDADLTSEITGLTSNSRNIKAGEIFLALPGAKTHGCAFLPTAVERGARAVITDNAGFDLSSNQKPAIPVLVIPNPRSQIGYLANWFYDSPSSSMYVAGITGTNGKTTTTYLVHQIWRFAQRESGLIGTIGIKISDEFFPSTHTTPESDVVQQTLSIMQERHLTSVAMEASSHALVQNRLDGVHFSVAGFTNLTQDHLDFHGNMENYYLAKKQLFTTSFSDFAIINIGNEYGKRLAQEVTVPFSTYALHDRTATWHFTDVNKGQSRTAIAIRGEGGILIEGEIDLLGEFNLENLLLAVAIAVHSGVDPMVIANALPHLTGAPGRLQKVDLGQDFLALVDYAHTPDAVTKVLQAISVNKKGRIIGVLGCGGDRDKSKRALMGKALSELCDVAIFTNDNPRGEDPKVILLEMLSGVGNQESVQVIEDRAAAILHSVSLARKGDVVIVLGKGHETGQEINGVITPFSDQLTLEHAIRAQQ